MHISLVSWNVNGIRAAERKGFLEWMERGDHDIVCVQETKLSDVSQLSDRLIHPNGYQSYIHCASEKKGYSGTAVYSKRTPKSVKTDFGDSLLSTEGRLMEISFDEFVLLNGYFPNGGGGEDRLRYKLAFYNEFFAYVSGLVDSGKRVVFCGDINTAHNAIDLARPKENEKHTGFLRIERDWMDLLVSSGFVDTFRALYPNEVAYSYWDQKTRARDRNVGWRIDYVFVSASLRNAVSEACILGDVHGSDHCPVGVVLDIDEVV
jgi:exodeoxyribonuclease-3